LADEPSSLLGGNARIDMPWGGGDPERYRKYTAELAALAPDVVFAATRGGSCRRWGNF